MGTLETVKKMKKADLIKHYLTWYRPNNSAIAIVGQFPKDFEKNVTDTFKLWAARPAKLEPLGDLPAVDNLNVHLVTKEGLKQTQIRLGRPGVKRNTDDFLVLRATSQILGGSGASRLMQRVRDDLGLTYGVYSAFDFRKDKGAFYITTFTKNESVGQTLKETIDVYNKFAQEGANEKELDAAKAQMIGQFPRAIETPDLYAYNILVLDFYGIPFSYLENYIDNVLKITVADVNNAIKKYLPPNKLSVLIYGDQKQIANQLKGYNPEIEKATMK
jgi:zinc protease